jgi:hypothetical protein
MHFLFVSSINAYKCHIILKLFINLACSVCTEKYRTSVFLYKPRPTGSVCTKKSSVRYCSVQTSRSVNKKKVILKINTRSRCDVVYRELDGLLIKSGFIMGLMQVSVQFPAISVTILEVLYVVYIIITSVHQKF